MKLWTALWCLGGYQVRLADFLNHLYQPSLCILNVMFWEMTWMSIENRESYGIWEQILELCKQMLKISRLILKGDCTRNVFSFFFFLLFYYFLLLISKQSNSIKRVLKKVGTPYVYRKYTQKKRKKNKQEKAKKPQLPTQISMKSIVDKIPKSCETFVHSKRAPMRFSVVLEMFSLTLELKSCNPKDLKLPFTSPIVW